MDAQSNLSNAMELGEATGEVQSLAGRVKDYQDTVTSKLNQMRTTHNNELMAARTKALQQRGGHGDGAPWR
jgi:hypothetical protein